MKLLLDTCTFLWCIEGGEALSEVARRALADPFDRMLICQALVAHLTLVTPDENIARYPVRTLW